MYPESACCCCHLTAYNLWECPYRNEPHQLPQRPAVVGENMVPSRQHGRDACRDVVGGEGVERDGDDAGHFPPQRPCQGIGRVGGGDRELDDAVDVAAVLVGDSVLCG